MIRSVTVIGAGNVATHLVKGLYRQGFRIQQVMATTDETARTLADQVNAEPVCRWNQLKTEADLYLVTTPDRVIWDVSHFWSTSTGIVAHTAGSVPLKALEGSGPSTAVLYPLQTFTKSRTLDLSKVPFFIEASDVQASQSLKALTEEMGWPAQHLSSEQRQHLHLAAILTNNFVNYLLGLAANQMNQQSLSWELLDPLLQETLSKAFALGPERAQTGPAMRGDNEIMEQHKLLLENSYERAVYDSLAKAIYHHYHSND